MINKEEMKYVKQVENALENNKSFYWQEDMHELIQIIKRNQERDKKIIKYLKQEINIDKTLYALDGHIKSVTIKSKYVDRKVYAREILGIFEEARK